MKQLDLLEMARTEPVDASSVARVRERLVDAIERTPTPAPAATCSHGRVRHEAKNDVRCTSCGARMERHNGDWRAAR